MKMLHDSEDAKAKRKSLKPLVEKRRRERMNRSLESLRTLLLQPQEASQRRVEKAEILEHTVLFLQRSAAGDGGGGPAPSFHSGFSACLQRATRYLGPDGRGQWLGAALHTSYAARFSRPDSDSTGARTRTEAPLASGSPPLSKSSRSILQLLINRYRSRAPPPVLATAGCVQNRGEAQRPPTTPQQPRSAAGPGSSGSPPQSHAVSLSLWRPWP